jgi:exosortase
VAVALAAAVAAYRDLLWFTPEGSLSEELEQLFFIPSQTLAPLVLLLAAWLLYRRARRLRSLPRDRRAPWLGGGLVAAGALLHLWATCASAPDLLVPSLSLVGLGCAALWRGGAAVRASALPAAFLLFAMPLPAPLLNEVVFRLQIATADLTGVLLTLLRVPHLVAGEQILRTRQTFSVIEACSGLRSIETLTMVAILMADLFRRPPAHTLALVIAAPPVAFFLNGWRAVALILNPHSDLVSVHTLQGVAILLGGLVLLFLLDGLLERVAGPRPARQAVPAAPAAAGPRGGRALAGVIGVLAALAGAGVALPRFPHPPPEPLHLSSRLTTGIGDLFSQELEIDRVFLGSAGFRESVTVRFRRDGHPVDVFLGLGWRSGRARSALSPKTAIPGSGWILEAEDPVVLPPDGREVRSLLFRSETQRLLVYHWYEGSLGLMAETVRALLAVDASPLRRAEEILAVRIATDVDSPVAAGRPPAAERLASFYPALRGLIDALQRDARLARGKPFPDFPTWEQFFLEGRSLDPGRMLLVRGLEWRFGLGMPLANPGRGAWDARGVRETDGVRDERVPRGNEEG